MVVVVMVMALVVVAVEAVTEQQHKRMEGGRWATMTMVVEAVVLLLQH